MVSVPSLWVVGGRDIFSCVACVLRTELLGECVRSRERCRSYKIERRASIWSRDNGVYYIWYSGACCHSSSENASQGQKCTAKLLCREIVNGRRRGGDDRLARWRQLTT